MCRGRSPVQRFIVCERMLDDIDGVAKWNLPMDASTGDADVFAGSIACPGCKPGHGSMMELGWYSAARLETGKSHTIL